MPPIATLHIPGRSSEPDEEAAGPTRPARDATHGLPETTLPRYPAVGAVALDAMAAIAGPTWTPNYERAWSAAFEVVTTAMLAGATSFELAVAA
jgi:hypothetical protein